MRNLFAGSIIAVTFCCAVTLAQNPQRDTPTLQPGQTQPLQPRAGQQPARQGQGSIADQQIAACLYGEASNEIEIAKLGESKATNEEVRKFAQQMVRDHTPARDEMKQLAGNLVSDSPQRTGETAGRTGSGGLDWIAVKKELGQQSLASTKKELSAKQSNEFDQCFMTQQAMAHHKMVDVLTVLRNHASNELRSKLDKELQMAQHHLQMAKDLAKKISDSPSERVTRRPEGNK